MLGPAVHRREKDTDHKTSMRVSGPNNVGKAMHYGSNIVGLRFGDHNKRNFQSCLLKSFTGVKLCATTRNNTQQRATECAKGRNI